MSKQYVISQELAQRLLNHFIAKAYNEVMEVAGFVNQLQKLPEAETPKPAEPPKE